MRIYFNSGSRREPKFSHGELTLPYLALPEGEPPWVPPDLGGNAEVGQWRLGWTKRRQGVRVGLADTTKTGKLDLVAGNYHGEIFFIPNRGSTTGPQFPQPQPFLRGIIPTTKDPTHRWGNVFAPLIHDWDGDGRPDLLIGEGSYSANNIHLLLNQGSAAAPIFNEEKRQPLALGQGREQLSPALADFNGDGNMDILVADRRGNITVYLRPAAWKPGDTIDPSGFVANSGGLTTDASQAFSLGAGISTISTGDFNGDGLFDLVVGRPNGRIAWSANTGTKEQPKFGPPADLKGTPPTPATWQQPSQWDLDLGVTRGNFLAYANVVGAEDDPGAQPVDGTKALKFSFAPTANRVLPRPTLTVAPTKFFDRRGGGSGTDSIFRDSAEVRALGGPNNFFVMRQQVSLAIGQTYTLTFQAKGTKVANAAVTLGWRGNKQLGEDRVVRGERGAVRKERNSINDSDQATSDFRPGASWAPVTKQYKIEFKKERELNKEKFTSEAILEISFELGAPDGVLY